MKKIGIALSGGGARGAYQIGVWKALKEHGIDTKISAYAGASVGSLNAFLIFISISNKYLLNRVREVMLYYIGVTCINSIYYLREVTEAMPLSFDADVRYIIPTVFTKPDSGVPRSVPRHDSFV